MVKFLCGPLQLTESLVTCDICPHQQPDAPTEHDR